MEIVEALGQLDVTNDEHWTGDGLPKVDVVAGLVGDDKLTRAMIVDAAPEFNRNAPPEEPKVDPVEAEVAVTSYERYTAALLALQEEATALSKKEKKYRDRRTLVEEKIHHVSILCDQTRPPDAGQQNITDYLASQRVITAEKAERRKALQESGIGEVLKNVGKAPIDEAMNKRKPARGSQRPGVRAPQG